MNKFSPINIIINQILIRAPGEVYFLIIFLFSDDESNYLMKSQVIPSLRYGEIKLFNLVEYLFERGVV